MSDSKESTSASAMDAETVKKTGRGFLVITAAKVWFLMTSAVIQLGLPIIFGSAEQFGVFKIVTEAIGLLNMVMIIGTLNAVSKLVSEQPENAAKIVNLAVRMQLMLGVPIAGLYFVASPWIAASFNDPTLTGYIRLSSFIILFYAFYAIFVGYLNGLKEFVKQAGLDIGFATLKMVGILGLVLLGFGVFGAIAGFVAAAGLITSISGFWVFRLMRRKPRAPEANDAETKAAFKRLLVYLVLIMAYTFGLNGLMRADLFILKGVAANMPASFVGLEELFVIMSNKFAGFYGAVLNIARIPYQGVIAVTFVIFPLISQSTFKQDLDQTRGYIRETFRYCMLLIGGVAMLLAFNSNSIIAGLYSVDYQAASVALSILSVSIIFFALFYVATTMIIGSGHPRAAVVIMGASLVLSAILNYIFVSRIHERTMEALTWTGGKAAVEGDSPMAIVHGAMARASEEAAFAGPYLLEATVYMQWAAIATTIAMVFGFLVSLVWLWRTFGAVPPMATIARLLLAAAVLFGLDMIWPLSVDLVAAHGKIVYL
ncbi:MAG: polysaccharide biosynthesis C-terminal domain-containing protein, partial [Bradymonadaceae bacterium]